VRFRVEKKQPELWDAVTGTMRDTAGQMRDGALEISLELPAYGSTFVVFRRALSTTAPREPAVEASLPITGGWTVEFEPNRGAPARIPMPDLISWTRHADPGVKYFSGSARYRKGFTVPAGWRTPGSNVELDLGRLWTIGEAKLNGKPLGIAWTWPFTLDCTSALRDGDNEIEIEVTNTWYNRLAGDARLPAEAKRITRTNVAISGGRPWKENEPLESGLFGPVRLVRKR
jgi:hypothetical protein